MIKITDIVSALNLTVVSGNGGLGNEVTGGYVSDLLSDVIGNAGEGNIWITLQAHHNVIAVASLKELSAIIIVRNSMPDEQTIKKSNEENIPILLTDADTFTTVGKIFELLKKE
jgi:predicted transcriptional regulator